MISTTVSNDQNKQIIIPYTWKRSLAIWNYNLLIVIFIKNQTNKQCETQIHFQPPLQLAMNKQEHEPVLY